MDRLQRRKKGSINFNRGWNEYEKGFGEVDGNYWLGLASLHQFLQINYYGYELRIDLKDYSGNSAYAKYSSFNVEDSSSKYTLSVSGFNGTAGDAIGASGNPNENVNGMKFSANDQDNDKIGSRHCAAHWKGGWWFNACHRTFLNGLYVSGSDWKNIIWYTWKGQSSLSFSEMKFRKKHESHERD